MTDQEAGVLLESSLRRARAELGSRRATAVLVLGAVACGPRAGRPVLVDVTGPGMEAADVVRALRAVADQMEQGLAAEEPRAGEHEGN